MAANIHTIRLGPDHCYIVQDDGVIMIDGGAPNQARAFERGLERASIQPGEVQLIVLTHGHWDHIASAKDIKEITGGKIAMHQREKDCLEKSLKPGVPGVTAWGRIASRINSLLLRLVHIPATDADVILGDEELSLTEYGIPGKVIHTPGHSTGSVSVLLETGEAFVGDLAMNMFPLRLGPGLPIFAEDLCKLGESWQLLLDEGAETVYPAHGKPFSADIIRKALS
jgi:glyoxylase-like metal-dependent hydrolase (beta-lactamase superfamily II)